MLALRSDKATPSGLPALSGIVVEVLHMDLDAKGNWYLSDTPPSVVIFIGSILRREFSLFPDELDKILIIRPSNAREVCRSSSRNLRILDEHHQPLSYLLGLHPDEQQSAAQVQWL